MHALLADTVRACCPPPLPCKAHARTAATRNNLEITDARVMEDDRDEGSEIEPGDKVGAWIIPRLDHEPHTPGGSR